MELKAILLSVTPYVSKKNGSTGYYMALSYNGQAKRVFVRQLPDVKLVPDPNDVFKKNLVPVAGVLPVILECHIGGFGEVLGVDVDKVEEA